MNFRVENCIFQLEISRYRYNAIRSRWKFKSNSKYRFEYLMWHKFQAGRPSVRPIDVCIFLCTHYVSIIKRYILRRQSIGTFSDAPLQRRASRLNAQVCCTRGLLQISRQECAKKPQSRGTKNRGAASDERRRDEFIAGRCEIGEHKYVRSLSLSPFLAGTD